MLPPKIPLASFRVNCCYPFEATGLDYAGPLDANKGNDNELRKCYILLFTCETVRAVLLETTRDFSSKSCMTCKPALFVSDKFKSFKCADVKKFILKHQVKWEFIHLRTPHWYH